jgi:putative membrane protein
MTSRHLLRLDEEARRKIEAAVQTAEARSTGQIVPVIVERSATYADVRWCAVLLGAGLATAAIVLGLPHPTIAWVLLGQGVGMAAGYALSAMPVALRVLAGKRALAQAARHRAMRAFLEHDLAHTAERTGVLLFASWLERQAVVLGDEAIHAKMKDGEWDRAIAVLTSALARGMPAEGFCGAIALVGDKLAEHFPAKAAAKPELPNALQVDDP